MRVPHNLDVHWKKTSWSSKIIQFIEFMNLNAMIFPIIKTIFMIWIPGYALEGGLLVHDQHPLLRLLLRNRSTKLYASMRRNLEERATY